jgi:hypothetical protein
MKTLADITTTEAHRRNIVSVSKQTAGGGTHHHSDIIIAGCTKRVSILSLTSSNESIARRFAAFGHFENSAITS